MALPLPKASVSSRNSPVLDLESCVKCLVFCFTGGGPASETIEGCQVYL